MAAATKATPGPTTAPAKVAVPEPVRASIIASLPFVRGADRSLVAAVAAKAEALEFGAGATIDGVGFLIGGKASASIEQSGERVPLASFVAPAIVGEASVFGAEEAIAIAADEPCRVLMLPPEVAKKLAESWPPFALETSRQLAAMLHKACEAAQAPPELATIVEEGLSFDPAPLASLMAEKTSGRARVPFAEIAEFELSPHIVGMVPAKTIKQHRMLPLKLADQHLTVGMVAPRNGMALAELKRILPSVDIDVVALSQDDYFAALAKLKLDDAPRTTKGARPSINPEQMVFETAEEREAQGARTTGDEAIKLVNRIIAIGLEKEASDIHAEPTATGMRVRYRVEGLLQDWHEPIPPSLAKGVVARVKVLAGLDITERRLPQDGRIGLSAGKREVDLRVSTLPANRGEKIVMRILESGGSTRGLDEIFAEPTTLAAVRRALQRPFGGIVVAGATGSGKTSTMYAMLNERKVTRPDTNILTVEDPIEYRLQGVTQVQVNPIAGLHFPIVLRGMLRQDPDVIVVGETRDTETARMALEAAMTGHLLLTSLHGNNAMSVLQRLEDLGCSRPLVAQSLALIVVQRLVRKLCPACVQLDVPPKALLETLVSRGVVAEGATIGLPRAVGCDACKQTGYVGRAVVVEALAINDELRNAIGAGRSLGDIERIALATNAFMPFHTYSAFLMGHKIVSGSEALLTVAE